MFATVLQMLRGALTGSRHAQRLPAHHRRCIREPGAPEHHGHAAYFGVGIAKPHAYSGAVAVRHGIEREQQAMTQLRVGLAHHGQCNGAQRGRVRRIPACDAAQMHLQPAPGSTADHE